MKPKWFPDWSDEICTIVASGPTATSVNLAQAIGRTKFVAVNNSWKLSPWADYLFAADYKWWSGCGGCPDFVGWKVTTDRRAGETREWDLLRLVAKLADDRIQTTGTVVGWGGNSGFQALNMVVLFGCKRIILVGYDATIKHGLHWHEAYSSAADNPTPNKTLRWQRSIDGAAAPLAQIGVSVINCSGISRLRRYSKMTYEDALSHFRA